jgi:hypothetical protein
MAANGKSGVTALVPILFEKFENLIRAGDSIFRAVAFGDLVWRDTTIKIATSRKLADVLFLSLTIVEMPFDFRVGWHISAHNFDHRLAAFSATYAANRFSLGRKKLNPGLRVNSADCFGHFGNS